MWFRNLQIYRLTRPFSLSPEQLHEQLQQRPARPCGSLEMSTLGWERPLGRHGSLLTHAASGCIMLCTRREEKIIPAAVIREKVGDKADALEQAEGRKVRRREREEIRDGMLQELLPKALTRSAHTYAYIDTRNGWLLVDAAAGKRAEELIGLLRDTLGTLPLRPLEVKESPAAVMTGWLDRNRPPKGFQVQDECELRDPMEEGGIVRCRRQDLDGEEIQAHLRAGKQVVKLSLEWQERLGFVLTEELAIKRLKFLDLIQQEAAETEAGDAAARFDADFALMTLELGRFVPRLLELFGGLNEEAGAGPST
jgi:recombination associated protein RdgC